jgi:hypothetical protein
MVPVHVVVAEMMKVVTVGEAVAEAAMHAAEPARYGVDLGQRDGEQNSRGNGEGFS